MSDTLLPDSAGLIESLTSASLDDAPVVPPNLVPLLRHRFATGALATEVAEAIAQEYSVPARLFQTLLRLCSQFSPLQVVRVEPAGARLDSPTDNEREPGWDGDGFQEFLSRSSHDLLTFDEEQALGRSISAGRFPSCITHSTRGPASGWSFPVPSSIADCAGMRGSLIVPRTNSATW